MVLATRDDESVLRRVLSFTSIQGRRVTARGTSGMNLSAPSTFGRPKLGCITSLHPFHKYYSASTHFQILSLTVAEAFMLDCCDCDKC